MIFHGFATRRWANYSMWNFLTGITFTGRKWTLNWIWNASSILKNFRSLRERSFVQTISIGHFGSASMNAWPYCFVKIRLSKTTTMPVSVFVRINRPTP